MSANLLNGSKNVRITGGNLSAVAGGQHNYDNNFYDSNVNHYRNYHHGPRNTYEGGNHITNSGENARSGDTIDIENTSSNTNVPPRTMQASSPQVIDSFDDNQRFERWPQPRNMSSDNAYLLENAEGAIIDGANLEAIAGGRHSHSNFYRGSTVNYNQNHRFDSENNYIGGRHVVNSGKGSDSGNKINIKDSSTNMNVNRPGNANPKN